MRPSARQALLRSLRSFRPLKGIKKAIPESMKSAVIRAIAWGRPGIIELGNGVKLSYPLDDWYWSRAEGKIRSYEPEIWFVLGHLLNPASLFIDCGANIGLWSCVAAMKIGNGDQVVAIEPGVSIYPYLQRNSRENGLNFEVRANAIWNKSGEDRVFFVSEGHASSSLVEDSSRKLLGQVTVQTVCIDDVVDSAMARVPSVSNIIVKLDVEGVECEAIAGAARTFRRANVLLIYEDHGHDVGSRTTELCLGMGLKVYSYINDGLKVIGSTLEAGEVKKDRHRGYNFFACKPGSGFDAQLSALQPAVSVSADASQSGAGLRGLGA